MSVIEKSDLPLVAEKRVNIKRSRPLRSPWSEGAGPRRMRNDRTSCALIRQTACIDGATWLTSSELAILPDKTWQLLHPWHKLLKQLT